MEAVMAPSKKSVDEIRKLASALNKETDELNATIERLEQQLADAKIGVAVWLNVVLEADERLDDPEIVNGREVQMKFCTGWDLGYCKIGDSWRIATKQSQATGVADAARTELPWLDTTSPMPLVSAPRVVRVAAADHLESLLSALSHRMQRFVESIQRAKKLAGE
jgi:hypothetical protein